VRITLAICRQIKRAKHAENLRPMRQKCGGHYNLCEFLFIASEAYKNLLHIYANKLISIRIKGEIPYYYIYIDFSYKDVTEII